MGGQVKDKTCVLPNTDLGSEQCLGSGLGVRAVEQPEQMGHKGSQASSELAALPRAGTSCPPRACSCHACVDIYIYIYVFF